MSQVEQHVHFFDKWNLKIKVEENEKRLSEN